MKSSSPKGILSEPVGAGAQLSDLTLNDLVRVATAYGRFPVYTSRLVPPDRIAAVSGDKSVVILGLSHADRSSSGAR